MGFLLVSRLMSKLLCSALMATGHGGLRRPWLVSARTPFERALLLNAFEFLDDQDRF